MSEDCPTCNNPIFNVRGAIMEMESTVRKARVEAATAERERIMKIIEEEQGNYSYKEELIKPSIVVAVFVNAVTQKLALR